MAFKPGTEKLGFREYHRRLASCRLCRFVAMSIMAAILIIETIILVPSYTERKREGIALMATEAVAALALTKSLIDSTMVEDTSSLWQASLDNTSLKGLYHSGMDKKTPMLFGEHPAAKHLDLFDLELMDSTGIYRNGDDFDVYIPATDSGFNHDLLLRLDGSPIHADLKDFVWNVAGLVIIISLFVTISSMLIVSWAVLQPLIGLREAFVRAGGDPDHPEKYLVESQREDEIGDLMASFNRMLLRTGQVLDELHRSQNAMEQSNARLEDEVMARTRSLTDSNTRLTQEIQERKELEDKARELARIPSENPNPVMRVLADGCLRYANTPSTPILQLWGVKIGDYLPDFWRDAAITCLQSGASAHYELDTGKQSFELDFLPVTESGVINVYGQDVSEIKMVHERLEHLARHDPLTSLPNRRYLLNHLDEQDYPDCTDFDDPMEEAPSWSLLLLDIDHFKTVNDSLPPEGADSLLAAFAGRLARFCDAGFIARTDGDEFAIVTNHPKDMMEVTRLARKLVEMTATPFHIDGQDIDLTLSVGVALCPHDGGDSNAMVNAAELALQRAKAEGRNTFRLFDPELGAITRERRILEKDLRHALGRGELSLHYQPKFSLEDRRLTSAEALLRWQHPTRGPVSPAQFIPIAEESGLIDEIGDWVLNRAICDFSAINKERQTAGLSCLPVAINLSARQLIAEKLATRVQELVTLHEMDISWLELEITESMIMEDIDDAIRVLEELATIGARLSIDDFGTGYSSLNYLRRLPVHKMKIDRSFVMDIEHDEGAAAVARSVMGLARALSLKTIAEGIETEGQLAILQELDCDEGQGWLVSRPLTITDFRDFAGLKGQDQTTEAVA